MPGTRPGMTSFAIKRHFTSCSLSQTVVKYAAPHPGHEMLQSGNATGSGGRSRLLARNECLECGHRLLRTHPLAEQMAFLIDPPGQVLGRQSQKLARDRDRFRRQRADLACDLARLGL